MHSRIHLLYICIHFSNDERRKMNYLQCKWKSHFTYFVQNVRVLSTYESWTWLNLFLFYRSGLCTIYYVTVVEYALKYANFCTSDCSVFPTRSKRRTNHHRPTWYNFQIQLILVKMTLKYNRTVKNSAEKNYDVHNRDMFVFVQLFLT